MQSKVANGEVEVVKVAGDKNIADALTKPVDGNKTAEHVARIGGRFQEGRHKLAPEVAEEDVIADDAARPDEEDEKDNEVNMSVIDASQENNKHNNNFRVREQPTELSCASQRAANRVKLCLSLLRKLLS